MSSDLSELLRLLKSHNVDFIVVGAHVLAAYARPRFTEDLDLWVRATRENASSLAAALREFGFDIEDTDAMKMAEGRAMIRLGAPPNRVDLINFLGAVGRELNFEELQKRGSEHTLMGEEVIILSKEDFIASKRAAGRPKDLRDIADLEEA